MDHSSQVCLFCVPETCEEVCISTWREGDEEAPARGWPEKDNQVHRISMEAHVLPDSRNNSSAHHLQRAMVWPDKVFLDWMAVSNYQVSSNLGRLEQQSTY